MEMGKEKICPIWAKQILGYYYSFTWVVITLLRLKKKTQTSDTFIKGNNQLSKGDNEVGP